MKIPEPGEIRKPSKTLAGVTPIAVMCKPRPCNHGVCLYCPTLGVPQSYTPLSPPVLRAEALKYDSSEQVKSRLKAFSLMNHPTTKIEVIIMGGNFLEYPKKYQYDFVKGIYDALNGVISKDLEGAKKKNENAIHRCVALCIETRPDSCTKKNISLMHEFGCTRVEIGVQAIDDDVYKKVNRGHTVHDVISATKRLKDDGFKVGYHMMLALPGSDKKKDYSMFKELFSNEDYKPDQLKIYPCQVLKGSMLFELYEKGKYKPYTKSETQKLIVRIMKIIPNYCRVMRVMREIPPEYLIKGTKRIDLRKDIEEELKISGKKINEIRFREVGFVLRDLKSNEKLDHDLKMIEMEYDSSGGKEFFLEIVNKDNVLFGLLRLRIVNNVAFIREVHVYGKALAIGEKAKILGQHSGLGKQLMKKAEEIVVRNGINEIKVISGVGVREYYKKLGYGLDSKDIYMIKNL